MPERTRRPRAGDDAWQLIWRTVVFAGTVTLTCFSQLPRSAVAVQGLHRQRLNRIGLYDLRLIVHIHDSAARTAACSWLPLAALTVTLTTAVAV